MAPFLGHLCGFNDFKDFQSAHRRWVEAKLSANKMDRDESWTHSIAVGSRPYIESFKNQMNGFGIGRKIQKNAEGFELREPELVYNALFDGENSDIQGENLLLWEV